VRARLELLGRMRLPAVVALVQPPPGLSAAEAARLYLLAMQQGAAAVPEAAAVDLPLFNGPGAGGDAAAVAAAMSQLWELLGERLEGAGGVLLPTAQAVALQQSAAAMPRALPDTVPAVTAARPSYSAVVAGRALPTAPAAAATPATPMPMPMLGYHTTPSNTQQQQQQPADSSRRSGGEADGLTALLARVQGEGGQLRASAGLSAYKLSDAEASVLRAKQLLSSVSQQLQRAGSSIKSGP